jgi:hypothetical protein
LLIPCAGIVSSSSHRHHIVSLSSRRHHVSSLSRRHHVSSSSHRRLGDGDGAMVAGDEESDAMAMRVAGE